MHMSKNPVFGEYMMMPGCVVLGLASGMRVGVDLCLRLCFFFAAQVLVAGVAAVDGSCDERVRQHVQPVPDGDAHHQRMKPRVRPQI